MNSKIQIYYIISKGKLLDTYCIIQLYIFQHIFLLHRARDIWETYYSDSSNSSPVVTNSNSAITSFFLAGFPIISQQNADDEFERQVFVYHGS